MTALHTIDWLVILGYFMGLLALAWWVILKSKDTADDYFLAGRNLGWLVIGASIFASNIGSEHLVGLAGSGATSGVAMAHYELHAWCLLVLGWVMVPFYMRSRVYTMPEFLERRFSPTARWVLSIISLVAYILTKIAVGIFAGGVVFGTLIPEWRMNLLGWELDSFWIGSAGGGAPDRPLHRPRRHARGRLHRGGPDGDPRPRLGRPHGLRAPDDRRLGRVPRPRCRSDMFNLWKPLVPAGMEGTWAPVMEPAGSPGTSTATTPGSGCSSARPSSGCGTGHRPVHRPARAGRPERARGAPRHDLRGPLEAAAGVHLHHPGNARGGPGEERQAAGPRPGASRPRRPGHQRQRPGRLPADGPARAPGRHPRDRGGRPAGRPDELARRRLQRLLDAVHHGPLQQAATRGLAGTGWCGSAAWRPRSWC